MAEPALRYVLVLSLAGALFLGACHKPLHYVGKAAPLGDAAWNHMKESSYAATDALISQAGYDVSVETPIIVGTVSNIDNVETSSSLGRMIAEQVGARLVQTGYDVREIKLGRSINVNSGLVSPDRAGEFFISRKESNLTPAIDAGAVVYGTYAAGKDRIAVNLRMVQPGTGKVIAAHDYKLVHNSETRKLLSDKNGYSFFSSGW